MYSFFKSHLFLDHPKKIHIEDLLVFEIDRLLRRIVAAVDLKQFPADAKNIAHLNRLSLFSSYR